MALCLLSACAEKQVPAPPPSYNDIARDRFNANAAELALPLFWRADENSDGALDPRELTVTWGSPLSDKVRYVGLRGFTPEFTRVYQAIAALPSPNEAPPGKPTLVTWDVEDKALVRHMQTLGMAIERLYSRQKGSSVSGLYPAELQKADKDFCTRLQKEPGELLSPFSVVEARGKSFVAVPYHVAFQNDMSAISKELKATAAETSDVALKRYLEAAAHAFETNDWYGADEAWTTMSSPWYVRIAPDEEYDEPCNQKGMFQLAFGRINSGSVHWRKLLEPVKADMEAAIAQMAGPPYKARAVKFQLPDFVDIILNAGDARAPFGATIGQSLPNSGPVAEESRGRTMAYTNFYSDADSRATHTLLASSLLDSPAMTLVSNDTLMSTVLHEAAHNLGPAHSHKIGGKNDSETFGGPLASMLEELKAQTAATYFADWLAERKLITDEQRRRSHLGDIVWGFSQISHGMADKDGKMQPYSVLAAVQLAAWMKEGAITFDAKALASNGKDLGRFSVDLQKMPAAVAKLMAEVARIKSVGDKKKAEALLAQSVDNPEMAALHTLIAERMNRAPRAVFIYAL